jgi:hypothetical protein
MGTRPGLKSLRCRVKPILFIDSGAFTAWTKKTNVDIISYTDFCLQNIHIIDYIANLDVIPGEFGKKNLTASEIDYSAKQGWKNYEYMIKRGIPKEKLIHIFHQDEDFKWLERMVDTMPYIGLSPANDRTREEKIMWLDKCMDYVLDEKGFPIVKFHGFAVTSLAIILRYPWFCMTDKHTILTKRGWLGRSEIKKGDYVLTFNNGKSEWKPVQKVHVFDVDNCIIRKYSGRFASEITLNHKWMVKTTRGRENQNTAWEWRETQDFRFLDKIPRSANHNDFPKEKKYSDELIKLVAWVFTDGSVVLSERDKSKTPNVVIYQCQKKHPESVKQIRELLTITNAKWSESITKEESGGDIVSFWISGFVKEQIAQILGVGKNLTFDFILSLTESQCHLFVKEVLKGEGSYCERKKGKTVFDFTHKNKNSLEAFKLACILTGHPISSYEGIDNYEHVLSSNIEYYTPANCTYEDKIHSGKIWCIEVENHTFMTRCGGSYYWTGNSVDSTTWLMTSSQGAILVPVKKGYHWDFTVDPMKIYVTDRTRKEPMHYHNLPKKLRFKVNDWLNEKNYVFGKSEFRIQSLPYTPEENERWVCKKQELITHKKGLIEKRIEDGVSNNYKNRDEINVLYFMELQSRLPRWPWKFQRKDLGFKI